MVKDPTVLQPAPAVQNLQIIQVDGSFDVNWARDPGVFFYAVSFRKDGVHEELTNTTTGQTQHRLRPAGGVTCEVTYTFRVMARGNGNDWQGDFSTPASTTVTTAACEG